MDNPGLHLLKGTPGHSYSKQDIRIALYNDYGSSKVLK